MNEHENELKKALAENGGFDAEKARSEADRARRWFDSRLKWSGRFTWIRTILFIAVFEFAVANFVMAASTKAMIGYAAVIVISLVLVGTIAVQSWVAGTKISLLREIKLLRLERLGQSTEEIIPSGWGWFSVTPSTRRALSAMEYTAWFLALIVIAGTTGFFSSQLSSNHWPSNMAHFEGTPVTIETPHIGAPIYYTIYLRMEHGVCKVAQVTPGHKPAELFWMGEGFVTNGTLPPGDSLRLDPQGNKGEYWVRFE
jgi:hypothetical protein